MVDTGLGQDFTCDPHSGETLAGALPLNLDVRLWELSVYGDLGLEGILKNVLRKLGFEISVAVKLALAKNRWVGMSLSSTFSWN